MNLILTILILFSSTIFAQDICGQKPYWDLLKTEINDLTKNENIKSSNIYSDWGINDSKSKIDFLFQSISKSDLKKKAESDPTFLNCRNVECIYLKLTPNPEIYYRSLKDHLLYQNKYIDILSLPIEQIRALSVAQNTMNKFSKTMMKNKNFQFIDMEEAGEWDSNNNMISIEKNNKLSIPSLLTILHEMGHAIDTESMKARREEMKDFVDLKPITNYSTTSSAESFAEHFSHYFYLYEIMNIDKDEEKSKTISSWFNKEPVSWLESSCVMNNSEITQLFSLQTYDFQVDLNKPGPEQYQLENGRYIYTANLGGALSSFSNYVKDSLNVVRKLIISEVQKNPTELKQYCDLVADESLLNEFILLNTLQLE